MLIFRIRCLRTLWMGVPMSSLRLAPTKTSECRFGSSLNPSCSKETQPCRFTRGDLGAVFCEDSWICSINDVLNIPSMQVLWPPWDKTTKPHLCRWILPQRDYWESWRSFTESTWKPLLKLRNQSNLILFKTHHAIARLIQMQVLIREDVQTVAKFIKEEVATRSLLPDSPKVLHGVLNLQISKEIKPKWLKRKGRHN